MAIFAFDGTTCTPSDLSNVFKMYDAYNSRHKFYATGPGSRGTWLSKLIESITGSGGKERLHDAFELWKYWQSCSSRETIVVGFSRGAVIAREFANQIHDAGGTVDLLAIYDSVGSFGNPLDMKDVGYRKKIPKAVKYCAHALPINEERFTFRVIRAKAAEGNNSSIINESWFPGVHSDVGGTLKEALGALSLSWMYQQAKLAKTNQWDDGSIAEANKHQDCQEPPSKNKFALPRRFLKNLRTRKILEGDTQYCLK